jgi:probable HAF family extracellular repeat protein
MFPGGTMSQGTGINANGQVAGFAQTGGGNNDAFLWLGPGNLKNLGTLQGGTTSQGTALNNSALETGYSDILLNGKTTQHAFTSNGGVMADLGTFPGGNFSKGFAINNSGVVAGAADVGGFSHAFTYAGSFTDLHTLGGFTSQANAINDSGIVAGSSDTGFGSSHAFRTDVNGVMHDLGTLPGDSISNALGINQSGQVTGYSGSSSGTSQAFRSDVAGHLTGLGTLAGGSSKGYSINDQGDVVGVSDFGGGTHAFIYTDHVINGLTGLIDLNTLINPGSGWVLEGATGINDNGQITGFGTVDITSPTGGILAVQTHAFLLVPGPSVPAPPSIILAAIGSVCAGLGRWRRRSQWPVASRGSSGSRQLTGR